MLGPEYLAALPDAVCSLWQQAEDDILKDVARRIRKADSLTDTAAYQAWRLQATRAVQSDTVKLLAKYSGRSRAEIRRLLIDAGTRTLADDDAIHSAAGKSPAPVNDSPALLNLLNAGFIQTMGTWQNLTATTASTVSREFERRMDQAWLQVSSGAFDYRTAVQRAVDDLADDMKYITYPSGHRDTLEVAVRRCVLTGVNQTAGKLQMARMEEMGCEYVEVTAHEGARPTHAVWQGKVYHIGGESVLDGIPYADFAAATGYGTGAGLCGWNCRHNFYPFYPGISTRNYTPENLRELNAKNVEYRGEHYTRYEISQMRRALERKVRKYKRRCLAEEAAGADTGQSTARLSAARRELAAFVQQTGGKADEARTSVAGAGSAQINRVNILAQQDDALYNQKKEETLRAIRSEDTTKRLNIGNQRKHIRESGRDIGNRSFLYGNLDDAQALVNQYSGTGSPKFDRKGNWTHKEHVVADHLIGEVVNPETGKATPTHRFSIHYGKNGTHIVPAKEEYPK